MATLYGIKSLLLLHYLEPFFKTDLDLRRSDHSHFKMISATTKVILATAEVTTATLKVISATTKVVLTTEEVITTTFKVI